ncbi:MAG: acylneuraminate cytidylyltransferase family protein [Bacteroidales bacterium]|nr:acylneuraminate cytidylyltransferase family protein [Bacteroidales bacterium]
MKPLVVIPARGGSKGVPHKNIKELNGKPMIQYTIEAAREVFKDEHICVSTDDFKIKEVVENIGLKVPFMRPAELATDTAGSYDVLLHTLSYYNNKGYEPDTIIMLQPTSPFRTAAHIKEALELYTTDLDMVVSVKETSSNPYFLLFEENKDGFLNKSKESDFVTRQECPKVWEYNGAIYIVNVESLKKSPLNKFKKVKKYVMDEMSSHDIDSMLDWRIAENYNDKKD